MNPFVKRVVRGIFVIYYALIRCIPYLPQSTQACESSHCPFSELKNKVTPPCKNILLYCPLYLVEGCIFKLYCHQYGFQSFQHNWTELPTAIQLNLGNLAKGLRVQL